MNSSDLERELEEETAAINRLLFDDGIGLPVAAEAWEVPLARQAKLAEALIRSGIGGLRRFGIETWADGRRVPLDNALAAVMDQALTLPEWRVADGPLTWRNWKRFEAEKSRAEELANAFEAMVVRSAGLVPALEQRLAQQRGDYGRFHLTPAQIFAEREGPTPQALRALLLRLGQASRPAFEAALDAMSRSVFGRGAGPAELRALYLNRMFEPGAGLFQVNGAVEAALRQFARLGFNLDHIPVDVVERPKKYPGAFCMPIRTPGDVRVSVRMASAHHLVDMLYHELGHAAHFSGIDARLPFVDRYWIESGTHETFSTLFERLLDQPSFLKARLNFDEAAAGRLVAFGRFKLLLTFTWLGAAGMSALDGWLENLSWAEVEQRYAGHMLAFTRVAMPPGFARLEPFTASLAVYPVGYVIANLRVWHWLRELEAVGGAAWWESPAAQADIAARIRAGGQVRFPDAWWSTEGLIDELKE